MSDGLIFDSHSEADTERLAQALAEVVCGGLTIALNGQLGSGKTFLVRSLCRALGVDPLQVNSPTFVLLQLYTDGRLPVAHFDTYRLADADEFLAIGADDFLNCGEYLCLVEWAERVAEILPADHLTLQMTQTAAQGRRLQLTAHGPLSRAVLEQLQQRLATPTGDERVTGAEPGGPRESRCD